MAQFKNKSDDIGPFPAAPVRDPRPPKPTHHPQYHFQPSTHYSIKCFQGNTPSSFVALHGDGVRALGKRFDGDLFFQTRKSSTGGHCIWVEPNCPQMLESEEIKKQLENAYALMFEWSRNPGPGGCLQEMDKFLEGYQKRGAKPTARGDENEVEVDTELKGASPEKVQARPAMQRNPKKSSTLESDRGTMVRPMKRIYAMV